MINSTSALSTDNFTILALMITFDAEIERFEKMGEKTGWTFVHIPAAVAQQIKAGCKMSFRVKGWLDEVPVEGLALTPMGEGNFILALKADLRRKLRKEQGASLRLQLEEHKDFIVGTPEDLELCLMEERHCLDNFMALPQSHRHYFINWLNTAKTETTRVKRLTMIVRAMDLHQNFQEMIRGNKS